MNISIIIPTFNEAENIGQVLDYLSENSNEENIKEILISDGISEDNTLEIARSKGARIVDHKNTGRAKQMNAGAREATGDVFYFLHADSYPPKNFDQEILHYINKGYKAGSFRMKWDMDHWLLNFFAWFTRFNFQWCRGGDQSLYVEREIFEKVNGFNENYRFLEDYEIIPRIKRHTSFKVIQKDIITSARKYRKNGVIRLQMHVAKTYILKMLGMDIDKVAEIYYKGIREKFNR
ncbi:MAG: TIGR04283 family arsenosugar biosynthesis glycosyltransferase [Bacteroidota bacterium]